MNEPSTQRLIYDYIFSKLKIIAETTLSNTEDFSWEELAQGKYIIDLRGFGNSKYEVEKLLSKGNIENLNVHSLGYLIKNLKMKDYVFDQKTRNVKLFFF
jgi:ADP-dependent phosphofructokinase/glucokinase